MIVFEKIRWKNFLSTGNSFTEINFVESPSTLVIGSNGAGKSTMLDALTFVLFNKPFRKVTKSQLVNSINERETVVEIEFKVGTIEYKVIRGMKPNIFELYRNDNLIDQDAANRDYQKYLEQSILKFNYKSFTQVVILGSSTFVPFMQLGASHRREVIEDLLDIQVFSQMNMLLKERVKENNEILKECSHELAMAKASIESQKKVVSKLTVVNDERIATFHFKLKENKDRIDEIRAETKVFDDKINALDTAARKLAEKEKSYKKTSSILSKLEGKSDKNQKDVKFFENNSSCPTCEQDIDENFRRMKVKKLTEKSIELAEASETLQKETKKALKQIEKLRQDTDLITEYTFEVRALMNEEGKIMKKNNEIKNTINDLSVQPDILGEKRLLAKVQSEYDEKEEVCAGVNKEARDFKIVAGFLKDDGIKAKIISKYVPIINQQINKYLSSMDTYINFTLDESFAEVIKSRHRDKFSYASFSEGEKQKIDLSLLFTWRYIAKLKNSIITNLLILDEVFDSSLDTNATEELLKILKDIGMGNTNMFIISHKGDVLLDKFDRTLKFDKSSEFSHCTEDV